MSYRLRENGAILTQGEVRKLFANTSFPAVWDSSVCDFIGIDPILESPQPTTTRFQSCFQNGIEQDALGNWVWKWQVNDFDQEAIDAAIAQQWESIRSTRNTKIAATDWTQVDDAPFTNVEKAAWATYRQALRDITTQADPFAIEWPVAPNEVQQPLTNEVTV